eukprot:Gb_02543 [translate_table: standard]
MEIVPGRWPLFGLGSGIPLLKLSVEDLGEPVYAWALPGVAGNAWNGEPSCSIAIGCIWGKFIFLAIGRPRDYMEMLLECLRNPGRRLGIVTSLQLLQTCFSQCEGVYDRVWMLFDASVRPCVCGCAVERKTIVGYGEETLAYTWKMNCNAYMSMAALVEATMREMIPFDVRPLMNSDIEARVIMHSRGEGMNGGGNSFLIEINGDSAWPLAPVWPGVRNSTVEF